jgi:hypothetical protein
LATVFNRIVTIPIPNRRRMPPEGGCDPKEEDATRRRMLPEGVSDAHPVVERRHSPSGGHEVPGFGPVQSEFTPLRNSPDSSQFLLIPPPSPPHTTQNSPTRLPYLIFVGLVSHLPQLPHQKFTHNTHHTPPQVPALRGHRGPRQRSGPGPKGSLRTHPPPSSSDPGPQRTTGTTPESG